MDWLGLNNATSRIDAWNPSGCCSITIHQTLHPGIAERVNGISSDEVKVCFSWQIYFLVWFTGPGSCISCLCYFSKIGLIVIIINVWQKPMLEAYLFSETDGKFIKIWHGCIVLMCDDCCCIVTENGTKRNLLNSDVHSGIVSANLTKFSNRHLNPSSVDTSHRQQCAFFGRHWV